MIRLTRHAAEAMELRRISVAWIEATISNPDRFETDPMHAELTRSYRAIAEFGSRILRVVHRSEDADIVVITAHFDRDAMP